MARKTKARAEKNLSEDEPQDQVEDSESSPTAGMDAVLENGPTIEEVNEDNYLVTLADGTELELTRIVNPGFIDRGGNFRPKADATSAEAERFVSQYINARTK